MALFSGISIAFALGAVASVFMAIFMPAAALDTIAQKLYEELASITLLTIPLFILKGAPIILPPLRAAGFDLIWFGIIMVVVTEMGLIHPPVGLNIFVLNRIAPDIGLLAIIWGTLPFVALMAAAVVILSVLPEIAMWLPDHIYG